MQDALNGANGMSDTGDRDIAKSLGTAEQSEESLSLMGNSKGRDNAKKRARRRRKTERLALAKNKKPTR